MMDIIDKQTRARLFRDRLRRAVADQGLSQSALARATGVDRSTLSQLLTDDGARLPGAHVAAACASALGVSADWLLGLSDRPEQAEALLDAALSLAEAPRALIDEQVFAWHQEAEGYKIRYVPATLPDMLKTQAMLRWEYSANLGHDADQAISATQARLTWMQNAGSDYEIALPLHEIESLARAQGYYTGMPKTLRTEQLRQIQRLVDQLYPRLRLYLFDARRLFSAPMTVFGPLLAALYIGQNYIVFRDSARVKALSLHFDGLVRDADVSARDALPYLRDVSALVGDQ